MTPPAQNERVSVIIPTYKRPESLARAIESVLKQSNLELLAVELLIIDNDPAASAKPIMERFDSTVIPVRYEHEPAAGVANARNTAVAEATSRLIVFLDDDQSAMPGWLESLIETYKNYKTAVLFGPIETALPNQDVPHETYFKGFFARITNYKSGIINEYFGCGNCLIDLDQMPDITPLFNVDHNEIGGEDDFLFSQLDLLGRTFGWAEQAYVYEHVPEGRLTLDYTLRRAFAYGQGPSRTSWVTKKSIVGVAFWMMVGAGQTAVYGGISMILRIIQHENRAYWYDRTIQGLGKIFWGEAFDQKFYGQHST